MAYVKRRSYGTKRTYIAKRKFVPKFKKSFKKPVRNYGGYRKKYSTYKPKYKRR